MGTRQTAQPLGVALAALALPSLAKAHGPLLALWFPAVLCALAAVLVLVLVADPPRPPRGSEPAAPSPDRAARTLPRIHLASSMLVVPQFAVATFTLTYLVEQRHWGPAVAGRWVFAFQAAGAAGRVMAGIWSDRV